ncbi:major facilitator superfamily domain-containing protein, partial [Catenaria anguillulae PL171]
PDSDAPPGARRMAAVVKSWTRKDYIIVFAGIFGVAFFSALAGSMEMTAEPFVLSYLGEHSMLPVLGVFDALLYSVSQPIVAKLLDVFGRLELTVLCMAFYALSRVLMAAAQSFGVYAISILFNTFSRSGQYLLSQILIADASSLLNRGLLSNIVNLPFLVTVFIGPFLSNMFIKLGYQWIYIFSAISVPTLGLPIIYKLYAGERKCRANGEIDETMTWRYNTTGASTTTLLNKQLDLPGVGMLVFGLALFFLPFLTSSRFAGGFGNPIPIVMLVSGILLLAGFGVWEVKHASAKGYLPVFPYKHLTNRTAIGAMITIVFVFIDYALYHTFLSSYVRVTRNMEYSQVGIIAQLYSLTASLSAIFTGILIKYTKRHKIYSILGIVLHAVGVAMMITYRGPDSTDFEYILSQSLAGIGGGFLVCSLMVALQASVPPAFIASLMTFWLLVSGLGSSIGGAIAGALWTNSLESQIMSRLPTLAPEVLTTILGSIEEVLKLPVAQREAVVQAYVSVQRYLSIGAALSLVPAVIGVFL